MARAASYPFITGICTSIIMASYSPLALSNISSAARPFAVMLTGLPVSSSSSSHSISPQSRSSSASSSRFPARASDSASVFSFSSILSNASSTRNTVPFSLPLFAAILPPISSVSPFAMAIPRPAAGVSPSASAASKMLCSIPSPLSLTVNTSGSFSTRSPWAHEMQSTVLPPAAVCCTELAIRLSSIRSNRRLSPRSISGAASAMHTASSCPASFICGHSIF